MLDPKINFPNLVKQLLPNHKRQPVRLGILEALLAPLNGIFSVFNIWREETRRIIKINNQVIVLEKYLQYKYNNELIRVRTYDDPLLNVSLRGENELYRLTIGLRQEMVFCDIPLRGELSEVFGNADYIVSIPASVKIEDIRADIERFKQILIKYKIVQSAN